MKYTVAHFEADYNEKTNILIRKYVILGKNLSIEDAKKMKSENRGSWTYKEMYHGKA